MNVKEMVITNIPETNRVKESYETLDSSKVILNLIMSEVTDYTEDNILKCKKKILEEIREIKCKEYYMNEFQYEFIIKVNDINLINKEELFKVIENIKNRYIYDEAVLRLVNDNKLIPISNNRIAYKKYNNGSDILINAKGISGNKCYYVYLDSLCIDKCRVSAII